MRLECFIALESAVRLDSQQGSWTKNWKAHLILTSPPLPPPSWTTNELNELSDDRKCLHNSIYYFPWHFLSAERSLAFVHVSCEYERRWRWFSELWLDTLPFAVSNRKNHTRVNKSYSMAIFRSPFCCNWNSGQEIISNELSSAESSPAEVERDLSTESLWFSVKIQKENLQRRRRCWKMEKALKLFQFWCWSVEILTFSQN